MSRLTENERLKKIFKLTASQNEKLERIYNKTIVDSYKKALAGIRNDIAKLYEKFGDTVTYAELQQYNRLVVLERNIENTLKEMGVNVKRDIRKAIKEFFMENYYRTGYAVETTAAVKLGFGMLSQSVIDAAIYNQYDRIKWDKRLIQDIAKANQHIREVLTQGLIQGHGYAKIAKKTKDTLGKSAYEMLRIMRTEGHRAQMAGRLLATDKAMGAADKIGMKVKKVWVATLDDRTRDQHAEMDGQAADDDGIFHLPDGTTTDAPGHSGVAEHDINCRCDMVIEFEDMPYKERYDQTNKQDINNITYSEWKDEKHIT